MTWPTFKSSSTLIIACIALMIILPVQALSLNPFKADYDVYRGNSKVGMAEFILSHQNGIWTWEMNTRLTGFYQFLTSKRPYTHTQMQIIQQNPQLLVELSGDYPGEAAEHTAWFDFNHQTLYWMKNNEIRRNDLPSVIYNYHSVHLLYPQMLETQQDQLTISFYRKGKIEDSTLTLEKDVPIQQDGKTIQLDRITQSFSQSNKKMVYEYQSGNMAPFRIQQFKPGKDTTLMVRND